VSTPTRLGPWTAALLAVGIPHAALAQAPQAVPADAEKLYEQAAAAMIAKDYATACPAFERVTRLVPDGGGARLNLAECYEEWGKLASALSQYSLAEALAKKDNRKDRLKAASSGVARLKPRVATLTVDVPDALRSTPDLVIKLDGEVLGDKFWGVPYPVDKGAHTLVASAPVHESATVQVDVPLDGKSATARLPLLERSPGAPGTAAPGTAAPAGTPPATSAQPAPTSGAPGGGQSGARTAVVITGSALAVGAVIAGGVALGLSFVKADERQKASTEPFGRDAAQEAARGEAAAQNVALWCFAGGGAVAAVTLIVGLATRTQVEPPVKVGAVVAPGGSSLWVGGRF
jgi:hypothetical protein